MSFNGSRFPDYGLIVAGIFCPPLISIELFEKTLVYCSEDGKAEEQKIPSFEIVRRAIPCRTRQCSGS